MSPCSRTHPLSEAARDVADLVPGTPPSFWNRTTLSLLVLLLIVGGTWLGRRQRHSASGEGVTAMQWAHRWYSRRERGDPKTNRHRHYTVSWEPTL